MPPRVTRAISKANSVYAKIKGSESESKLEFDCVLDTFTILNVLRGYEEQLNRF